MTDIITRKIEATKLDYKLNLEQEKPKNWLKSVSAFANTSGGHIYFGFTDDTHEAVGLDDTQAVASKIAQLIEGRISPSVRYELIEMESDVNGRTCLDLIISNGPNYPYYYTHERTQEAYVRHGDRSVIATTAELNNLILKGQNKTYDALPSHRKLEDVSFTLLKATYKKETGEDFVLPRDLISMGFVDENGMVRNEIISDIFGRLHYMDRRGSGIGRIVNSYTDYTEKPSFFSNEYYFQVVLPNRSVASLAQLELEFSEETQLGIEKTQLTNVKTQLSGGKLNFEQDWELIYFKDMILEKVGKDFRTKTIDEIVLLFDRYRYDYSFNRRNVADLFGISENGASGFIKKCLEKHFLMKEKKDSYRFVNTKIEK